MRRPVIGKAEHLAKGANPRFVVTSLKRRAIQAKSPYERVSCARGEMENRIKEQQLDLYADRTSTATMAANQLGLWFSSVACVLLCALRRIGRLGLPVPSRLRAGPRPPEPLAGPKPGTEPKAKCAGRHSS